MTVEIDREALLDFFVTFARVELALKSAGFFQHHPCPDPTDPPDASPDWDKFAISLRTVFCKDVNPNLYAACEDILLNPPWREVICNDSSMWRADPPPQELTPVESLLLSIRRLRNNLFHGASFSSVQGYDLTTTENLLKASVIVLKECLRVSPTVQKEYEDATL